jgi:hypothetical protein
MLYFIDFDFEFDLSKSMIMFCAVDCYELPLDVSPTNVFLRCTNRIADIKETQRLFFKAAKPHTNISHYACKAP